MILVNSFIIILNLFDKLSSSTGSRVLEKENNREGEIAFFAS